MDWRTCISASGGGKSIREQPQRRCDTACLRPWELSQHSHCVEFSCIWKNLCIPRAASADSLIRRQGRKLNEAGELKPDFTGCICSSIPSGYNTDVTFKSKFSAEESCQHLMYPRLGYRRSTEEPLKHASAWAALLKPSSWRRWPAWACLLLMKLRRRS